jgi:uncharacterized protein (TIGR02271 family)
MPTLEDVKTWRGRDVVGNDGEKIGTLEDVYLDRQSGEPEWAAVKGGLFGTKISFVPLVDASPTGEELRVPYDKATVKDAPKIDADGELSPQEEEQLYRHYGRGDYQEWDRESDRTETVMGRDERFSTGDRESETTGRGPVGHDPTTGSAGGARGPETDEAMTRSEEELRVGTTQRETGRARLRKYVVTEDVQQTVPVQREELRVEREPITDANAGRATDGPAISEEEHEVTLHAEEPVVEKRVVPKERVRLDKETVSDEQQVSEEVRQERIEAEGDAEGRL